MISLHCEYRIEFERSIEPGRNLFPCLYVTSEHMNLVFENNYLLLFIFFNLERIVFFFCFIVLRNIILGIIS